MARRDTQDSADRRSTARRPAAETSEGATRALRTLSAGNRALLRGVDEAGLLREVCRVIVEQGGYRTAFVGYVEQGAPHTLRPVARAGVDAVALDELRLDPAQVPPTGAVLRIGMPPARLDLFAELADWSEPLRGAGCLAVSVLPLRTGNELLGLLCIGAAQPDAFDEPECRGLSQLADDLAYGISTLRNRIRHRTNEAQLERVHRALRTLSAGNRSLLRAATEQELLDAMCRVIVEEGGYPAAWVGYAQHDERKTIRAMAMAGVRREMVDEQLTWAETGIGLGPTGTAIRSGQPVIGRNLRTDPQLAPVRLHLRGRGFPDYGSASVFPLQVEGEVIGNLSIYALELDAFDEAEARLLGELTDDLGYGIGNLRSRRRREEAEETIKHMAFHDTVTGLPNRLLLRERLESAVSRARRERRALAVLVLKVEPYQEISNSLGYREGDHLLVELAKRLRQLLGDEQPLARGGEDEFVVIHPGSGAAAAKESARRLITTLYEPVELSGLTVNARVNIGIALSPGHGIDPDGLLRRASMAAHNARSSSGGYAVYEGSLDQDCTRRLAMMADLRRAIDNHELQLYCQPKVGIRSRRVSGAEALVRWPHPELGSVATGEFVKLAEHAGLIRPLTHWVLDSAFGHAYAWHEAGLDLPLAINLSAHDLRDPLLLDHIKGLFATWGISSEWIQFELTESALLEDPAGTLETLTQLKKLDVELYIDDFGTGYSGLSYLQKLPVDALKIDQSFVGSMIDSVDSSVIVRSTIDLGHNLNLRIVAEGVESRTVWERLSGLGCDTAQGYFVGPPMPAEDFMAWEQASRWHDPVPN